MTCRGEWIRKGNKSLTMTITPSTNSNPKPALIDVGRRVINRDTGFSADNNYTASELAAGVSWALKPRRVYIMALVVFPVGASIDVEIVIGDQTVAIGKCTRKSFPVTGRWKITTF